MFCFLPLRSPKPGEASMHSSWTQVDSGTFLQNAFVQKTIQRKEMIPDSCSYSSKAKVRVDVRDTPKSLRFKSSGSNGMEKKVITAVLSDDDTTCFNKGNLKWMDY
jgi:hypothetical protein